MEILKILFLFLAIWSSSINITKLINKNSIPVGNFILQATGITGFIYIQWLM